MSFLRKFLILLLVLSPVASFALTPKPPSTEEHKDSVVSAFRSYKDISPKIGKTSVIEVPFHQEFFSIPVFAVYNLTTSSFEPNVFFTNSSETKSRVTATGATSTDSATGVVSNDTSRINDNKHETCLDFPLNQISNSAKVTFVFDKPITSSSLLISLANYGTLPYSISVSANVSGKEYIVLAPVKPSQNGVTFLSTTSSVWNVVFNYAQPLRICEMKFNDTSGGQIITAGLRFLAQPEQSYRIYFDVDRYNVSPTYKEAGDLSSNTGVVVYNTGVPFPNSEYRPADSDLDSVPDLADNCTNIKNTDQKDSDGNGLGDACEDYDRDGIVNVNDNCSQIPNVAQTDTDKDKVGDVCDDFENRVTERLPWLPWVGIGVAGVVIFGLFFLVLKHKKEGDY